MSKGTLLVLTGASSVGKGAIRDCLLEDESLHLFYSISMTTRPRTTVYSTEQPSFQPS